MSAFALNLLLAVAWMFLHDDLSLPSLIAGSVIGFLAIAITQAVLGHRTYARAALAALRLAARFVGMLFIACVTLARDVLRRVPRFDPAFVRVDVPNLGPVETVLLANLVSLTPGTLTVDTAAEGGTIYVHALYASEIEAIRRDILRSAALIQAASEHRGGPRDDT